MIVVFVTSVDKGYLRDVTDESRFRVVTDKGCIHDGSVFIDKGARHSDVSFKSIQNRHYMSPH